MESHKAVANIFRLSNCGNDLPVLIQITERRDSMQYCQQQFHAMVHGEIYAGFSTDFLLQLDHLSTWRCLHFSGTTPCLWCENDTPSRWHPSIEGSVTLACPRYWTCQRDETHKKTRQFTMFKNHNLSPAQHHHIGASHLNATALKQLHNNLLECRNLKWQHTREVEGFTHSNLRQIRPAVEILLSCRGYPPGSQPMKPVNELFHSGAAVRVLYVIVIYYTWYLDVFL